MKAPEFKFKVRTDIERQRTRVALFDMVDDQDSELCDSGYQTDQIRITKRQALNVERHMSLSGHVTGYSLLFNIYNDGLYASHVFSHPPVSSPQ